MGRHKWPLSRKVEVEWIDSCSTGRWASEEDYRQNAGISVCRSTGYLLSKDKREVILVQSMSNTTANMADAIAIPTKAVVKVRKLRGGL